MKILISVLFYVCIHTLYLEANNILFSKEELRWIQKHQEIKVGVERDWVPFDYVDKEGKHLGLSQDYLKKISNISGLNFKTYPKSWSTLLKQIKAKKIDMLPALYYSKERLRYINFTPSYLDLAEYLFTLRKVKKLINSTEAYDKTIAVIRGYELEQWLRKRYPRVKIVLKDSIYDCIQSVSSGESFGFIGDLPSTQAVLQKYFINNIKVNTILSDRDPVSVHMGIRKDYPLLESIISKSLEQISRKEKEHIFSQYASDEGFKGLIAAFGFDRPPYMYDKNSGKGIEESLVRQILKNRGLSLKEIKQVPMQRGQTILKDNSKIDFSVGVFEDKTDGLFYSDNFIKYENVAISRSSDKIQINKIQDLKGKTVVAWEKASLMLGKEFKSLFNLENRPVKYTETYDQKLQHQNFFLKKADVILVDKNIFQWYVNKYKYRYDTRQEYTIHPIFSEPTWVKVSFRDKRLRDEFNLGLKALRKNGMYDEIISRSLKIDLQKQLNLIQFIAAISAEYIFEGDTLTLKKIFSKFSHINIIKGIEFISTSKDQSLLKLERHNNVYKEVKEFSWGGRTNKYDI
ncbi:transporter substrate-binding domain-containing protein [Sulfurimonas sp. MAG313]|nr:transporter substrate-binding domain-containing protein [Sulfurimonas sp. MAG313]MDF1881790.1 transporter substrate-binding domain-containing protein [Sulfurimonas sp. MAG313]